MGMFPFFLTKSQLIIEQQGRGERGQKRQEKYHPNKQTIKTYKKKQKIGR